MRRKSWISGATLLLSAGLCVAILSYQPLSQQINAPLQNNVQPLSQDQTDAPYDDWRLIIVNKQHPIPDNFSLSCERVAENQFADSRMADQLLAMLDAAKQDGVPLYIVSSYRSLQRQQTLYQQTYNDHLASGMTPQQAKVATEAYQAPPGTSEHATGLAFDIVGAEWFNTHTDLTTDFDQTPAYEWLYTHAPEYGFILRYPKDKEEITGYSYEPWHYRYVGKENARAIMQQGITLEEYVQQ